MINNLIKDDMSLSSIVQQMASGHLSAKELIVAALSNIEAYDNDGPKLRALSYVNKDALAQAQKLDDERASTGQIRGPLHGLPIVVKDNLNIKGVATTGGCRGLMRNMATTDSTVVSRIMQAGGVIIAKSNMHELALGGISISSGWGQVRNPYDLSRTPGGSSGGSAVAVKAGFCVAAIGTDTVNSIRSPAAATGLVGLRPTQGLVSRAGLLPVSEFQDVVGPIARSAADASYFLQTLRGFDVLDDRTSEATNLNLSFPGAKTRYRVGVSTKLLGSERQHVIVNDRFNTMLDSLIAHGWQVCELSEWPHTAEEAISYYDVQLWEFKEFFNRFVKQFRSPEAITSLSMLIETGEFLPIVESFLISANSISNRFESMEYLKRIYNATIFRRKILSLLEYYELDAMIYPHQKSLVAPIGVTTQPDRNGIFAAITGLPAITIPICVVSTEKNTTLPIGVELLGRPYQDEDLCSIAASLEEIIQLTTNTSIELSNPKTQNV